MLKKIFCFCLLLIIFSGCEKEPENLIQPPYDTIFPGPYLPVYPGSFWVYNSGTIQHETSSNYVFDFFTYENNNITYESKPCYVPIWRDIPIYGYSAFQGFYTNTFTVPNETHRYMIKFLSEVPGDKWVGSGGVGKYGGSGTYDSVVSVNVQVNSGVNIFDSVIVVQHYQHISQYGGGFYHDTTYKVGTSYFAKNIGLIREDDGSDSTILVLDNYYINH